ncbi:TIGR01777 family oxidoreductase [Alkalibacillus sp. S2W]|uniref:TIGR01777 family oxidoreductase n=1 Tax=Alkalibacillus sp. S2W TaxID=3386553 RepID=UPI00398C9F9E
MKIVIAGGTGFVGQHLVDHFSSKDDEIIILTRNPNKYQSDHNIHYIEWLTPNGQPELEIGYADVFINLAGESLNSGRWTEERKERILESRMTTTRELIRIMGAMQQPPHTFVNASAVGYYGTSETDIFTEQTQQPGNDFLAEVCDMWEKEADEAKSLDIRVIKTRFGLILDGHDGALPKMALPYQLFAGGPLGSGEQWMSWIHIYDVVKGYDWVIEHSDIKGPVNFTAPNPKRNKEFGKVLGQALKRPHWIPAPSFAIRTALGDMSTLLLEGQYVYPKVLLESGYTFHFPTLKEALEEIYQ